MEDLLSSLSSTDRPGLLSEQSSRATKIYGNPNLITRPHPNFCKEAEDPELVELVSRLNVRKDTEAVKYFEHIKREEDMNEFNITEV